MQLQAYHAPLPFVLDREAQLVLLPSVNLDDFDPQAALSIREAVKLMRGRTRPNPSPHDPARTSLRHVHIHVAGRWARRGWSVQLEDRGEVVTFTLRLPVVKLGGELLTMPAWVRAFENARWRLSARHTAG